MMMVAMTRGQADLELAILQAEADSTTNEDLREWLIKMGLHREVVEKLVELLRKTARVGKKVFDIGKIIVMKIVEFVRKYPKVAVGMALFLTINYLFTSVPVLGSILGPVIATVSVVYYVKQADIGDELKTLIREAFQWLAEVFRRLLQTVAPA